ncbi:hypothetical protein [Haloarcula amylovorans]|uniref:hypothetical protein n=1 Tax=Haloarcula amylovorans TaxID=2562280 RepID=UPI001ADDC9C6|nr:hypothetical protein [Halomicroarcula amylolytica]
MDSAISAAETDGESIPNEQLLTMFKEQQAQIEHLQDQVEETQKELEEEREKREELENSLEFVKEMVFDLDDVVIGSEYTAEYYAEDYPPVLAQLDELNDGETLGELREDVIAEQKTRSREDSQLRRKLNEVAQAADVDVENIDVAGKDKIQRIIANGCDDVVDRVYPVHERAREVLMHAGDWGYKAQDKFGNRITLKGPEVREKLELRRDESLQSKQVRDVFEKIVELASDSPRKVKTTKNEDGIRVLRIHLEQEGL